MRINLIKLICASMIILLCLFFQPLWAKKPPLFQVNGVEAKAGLNVVERLQEYTQSKPISNKLTPELKLQAMKALQAFGYFNAKVNIKVISPQQVLVQVESGTQTQILSFHLEFIGEGAQNPVFVKVREKIVIHIGDPLLTQKYNKTKLLIINSAESAGYLHGSFKKSEIMVDKVQSTAEITLIFDTGPLFYFSQVQFNPTTINPRLLHRYVPFQPGSVYSTDQVLKLNNDLSNSGYFSSVMVKPQITDDTTVPVDIQLQPVPKYSYSLGLGYGTDTGIRGRAALHIVPVNQWGHTFHALAQGSMIQNALQAQYLIPGANPVADKFTITGNFSNMNYDAGYGNGYLLSVGQQHRVDHYKRSLTLNALYERYNYTSQPNKDEFVLYPKASFAFNNSQNKLFTPTGYNVTFNVLGASQGLLSTTSLAQGSVDAKGAYMIEAIRLRLYGHAYQGLTAISQIDKLPLSLALLLGGTDNLKALSFNSVGPGRVTTYGGFELQKELVKNWYAVGFYDVGAVYNPLPKDTRYDAGAALMWVSPIGPIKIGVAQAIGNGFQNVGNHPRLVVSMGPDL